MRFQLLFKPPPFRVLNSAWYAWSIESLSIPVFLSLSLEISKEFDTPSNGRKDEAIHLLTSQLANKAANRTFGERGWDLPQRYFLVRAIFSRPGRSFHRSPFTLERERERENKIRKVIHAFASSVSSFTAKGRGKAHVENGDFLWIFVPVHVVFPFYPRFSPSLPQPPWLQLVSRRVQQKEGRGGEETVCEDSCHPSFVRISMVS